MSRFDRLLLYGLYGFTIIAVAGFGIFGRHPELLVRWPELAAFYARSFALFARVHVLLTAFVLFAYMGRRVGGRWVPAGLLVYGVSCSARRWGPRMACLSDLWLHHPARRKVVRPRALSDSAQLVCDGGACYVLARAAFSERRQWPARLLLATYLLVAWDLSLDPAMSYLTSYWTWGETGPYYGMPLINLAGWALTGLVIMGVLEAMRAFRWTEAFSVQWMAVFYGAVLLMPLGMVAVAGLWGAVAATVAALGLAGSVVWLIRRRRPRMDITGALPARDAFEEDGTRFFAAHARSFSFAARLFPKDFRREVVLLYGFCRLTDDLVDGASSQVAPELLQKRLDRWQRQVRMAYEGRPSGLPWLDRLMQRSRQAGLPWEVVQALLDGVRQDIGPVRVASYEELDRYAYRVGSTVGVWMCYLMEVRTPRLLARAEALGRAMQYTNIVRDVGEDLQCDRLYLPADRMAAYGLDLADLLRMQRTGVLDPSYVALLEELMQRAERDYEAAWEAIPALPPRVRSAIAVAAEVYRGIHEVLRQNHYDNLTRRAYTTLPEKKSVFRWLHCVACAGRF